MKYCKEQHGEALRLSMGMTGDKRQHRMHQEASHLAAVTVCGVLSPGGVELSDPSEMRSGTTAPADRRSLHIHAFQSARAGSKRATIHCSLYCEAQGKGRGHEGCLLSGASQMHMQLPSGWGGVGWTQGAASWQAHNVMEYGKGPRAKHRLGSIVGGDEIVMEVIWHHPRHGATKHGCDHVGVPLKSRIGGC